MLLVDASRFLVTKYNTREKEKRKTSVVTKKFRLSDTIQSRTNPSWFKIPLSFFSLSFFLLPLFLTEVEEKFKCDSS